VPEEIPTAQFSPVNQRNFIPVMTSYTRPFPIQFPILIARLRAPGSRMEVDVVSVQSDGTCSIRTISSDDRGESYPVKRVLAALGDESLAVDPFQFWTFLPVLLLTLTGPWIGLGLSVLVLGIKAMTGTSTRMAENRS
jgi:hypothetical protein